MLIIQKVKTCGYDISEQAITVETLLQFLKRQEYAFNFKLNNGEISNWEFV